MKFLSTISIAFAFLGTYQGAEATTCDTKNQKYQNFVAQKKKDIQNVINPSAEIRKMLPAGTDLSIFACRKDEATQWASSLASNVETCENVLKNCGAFWTQNADLSKLDRRKNFGLLKTFGKCPGKNKALEISFEGADCIIANPPNKGGKK